jgi:hypothetical protein
MSVPDLADSDDNIDEIKNFYAFDKSNIAVYIGHLILHSFNSLELININFLF